MRLFAYKNGTLRAVSDPEDIEPGEMVFRGDAIMSVRLEDRRHPTEFWVKLTDGTHLNLRAEDAALQVQDLARAMAEG